MGLGVVITHWGDTSKLKGVKKPEAMSRSGQTKRKGNRLQAVGMFYSMQTGKGTGLFQEKPVIHCDCSQERKVAELRRG